MLVAGSPPRFSNHCVLSSHSATVLTEKERNEACSEKACVQLTLVSQANARTGEVAQDY